MMGLTITFWVKSLSRSQQKFPKVFVLWQFQLRSFLEKEMPVLLLWLFYKWRRGPTVCQVRTFRRYDETLFVAYSIAILLMSKTLGVFQCIVPILLDYENNMAFKEMLETLFQVSLEMYIMADSTEVQGERIWWTCMERLREEGKKDEGEHENIPLSMYFLSSLEDKIRPQHH